MRRAGLLTDPIIILTSEITKNEFGEETTEWVEKYKTKARPIHDGGTRTEVNSEIVYTFLKSFEIRNYVPIDEYDRIIWDSKTFRVLNIDRDSSLMKTKIRCELVND